MFAKIDFNSRFFVLLCFNIFFCFVTVAQNDKNYSSPSKGSKFYTKNGTVNSKQKYKKMTSRAIDEYGPAKEYFSFFDYSMVEFGPAEIKYYLFDASTENFGAAESSSSFYNASKAEFGPSGSSLSRQNLTVKNFIPKLVNLFHPNNGLLNRGHGTNSENAEVTYLAYSGRGATIKAGVVRNTPRFVSRFPSKEEMNQTSERNSSNKTRNDTKVPTQPSPNANEDKEIMSPR